MASIYTFNNKAKYMDSVMSNTETSEKYTFKTIWSSAQQTTSIISWSGHVVGIIDWGQDAFQVGDVRYHARTIGKSQATEHGMSLAWRFMIGDSEWYIATDVAGKTFKVLPVPAPGSPPLSTPLMTFHEYGTKPTKPSKQAKFVVAPGVSTTDMLFAVQIIVYLKEEYLKFDMSPQKLMMAAAPGFGGV